MLLLVSNHVSVLLRAHGWASVHYRRCGLLMRPCWQVAHEIAVHRIVAHAGAVQDVGTAAPSGPGCSLHRGMRMAVRRVLFQSLRRHLANLLLRGVGVPRLELAHDLVDRGHHAARKGLRLWWIRHPR